MRQPDSGKSVTVVARVFRFSLSEEKKTAHLPPGVNADITGANASFQRRTKMQQFPNLRD